ncbi:MAG: hypothetical protein J0I20_30110 [Chloroflexi bacterium]|nr:hypothetical protein [Chloroflexota bacterium]
METTTFTLILLPVSLITITFQYLAIMRHFNQDKAAKKRGNKEKAEDEYFLKEEALD